MVLSAQIAWSENVENALSNVGGGGDVGPLQSVLSNVEVTLNVLADSVLMEQPPLRRRKLEHLVSLIPEPCLPSAIAVKGKDALKCAFCIKRKISLELGLGYFKHYVLKNNYGQRRKLISEELLINKIEFSVS